MLYPYFWRLLPLPTQILIDCNLPIELEGTQELFRTHDSETTCELLHDRAHLIRKQNQLPEVFKTVMQNATKRIILITGCDSGFGALSAIALSSSGYRVVSACLTEDGAERLRAEVALAVVCDVTKEKDISRLTSIIAKLASDENLFLWAVINNAGVAPIGYMEWISMESVKKAMDVNYFGMISVIKAMLPLLKKTKGSRIINISSSAGLGGGAALGAYAASKHAVEGMTKCLRLELKPWGIHVANVNPAFMKTPMCLLAGAAAIKEFKASPPLLREQYPEAENMLADLSLKITAVSGDPAVVVAEIKRLLVASNPSLVNWVGWLAHIIRLVVMLPYWIQELIGPAALPRQKPFSY